MSTPDDATRHEPPHSLEAEQSVLGALLLDNQAWDRVSDLLVQGDFFIYEHKLIFSAIATLLGAGKAADVVTVHEQLERQGANDEHGGLPYLNKLTQSVPGASNMRVWAAIVRDRAAQRQVIVTTDLAASIAWETGDEPLHSRIDRILALFEPLRPIAERGARELGQIATPLLEHLLELHGSGDTSGRSLGLPTLDRMLDGGVSPGRQYVLAARPSIGKSSLAMALALALSRQGVSVLVHSLEMSGEEVALRCLASISGIDASDLAAARLSDDDWSRLSKAADDASRLPLRMDDEGGLTLPAITARAQRELGTGGVLILDYLQLTASTEPRNSRNDQIETISRGLKALAKRLQISVIVLSQLNREIEKRSDKRPTLADLRDSGAIEQDADAVLMMWALDKDDAGGRRRSIGLSVEKNRHGATGALVLSFEPALHRWAESTAKVADFSRRQREVADL